MSTTQYQALQSHLFCQFTQSVTTDELRTGVGQETLTLAREMVVDDMSDNSIEQGIAQELQTLIVQRPALLVTTTYALVHQRLLVITDVVRVETHHLI